MLRKAFTTPSNLTIELIIKHEMVLLKGTFTYAFILLTSKGKIENKSHAKVLFKYNE